LKAPRPWLAVWCRAFGIDAGAGAADATGDATAYADSGSPTEGTTATAFLDSVHLPRDADEPEDERVVRPSLALLFRMAVGPGADYYAPRFLEYERTGSSFPSWNWAALWAPAVWAMYRRLWLPAIGFAAWPLLALALYGAVEPEVGGSGAVSMAVAAFLVWLGPGLVAATIANTLVYGKARRLVGTAEARMRRPEQAVRWLSQRTVTAPIPAALAGTATILLVLEVVIPSLQATYADQVVRSRIAESLAAIQPLQRQLEEWLVSPSPSAAPDFALAQLRQNADPVDVSLASGRVRLALGALNPELSGRSILLAPALDRRQQVRWICVPVDVPARYLPRECRQG
jgi:hypothetical protein